MTHRLNYRLRLVAEMPSSEPERFIQAVRSALPELLKLDRYERRAAARRDRATRHNVARTMLMRYHRLNSAKRSQFPNSDDAINAMLAAVGYNFRRLIQ